MEQYAPVGLAVLSTLLLLSLGAASRVLWLRLRERRVPANGRPGEPAAAGAAPSVAGRVPILLRLAAVVLLLGSAGVAVVLIRDSGAPADGGSAPASSEAPAGSDAPTDQGSSDREASETDDDTGRRRDRAAAKRRAARRASARSRASSPAPNSFTVAVLNATGVTGLAAETALDLERRDFGVGAVDDAPATRSESVVMHAAGARKEARLVRSKLDIRRLERATEEVAAVAGGAEVMVVLGDDRATQP